MNPQNQQQPQSKCDAQILHQYHQFVRDDELKLDKQSLSLLQESLADEDNYGKYLAQKYYSKLYKEYAIADFTFYEQGKIGLRWRTKKEVIQGKGFRSCGNKKCENKRQLGTFEINFVYMEQNEKKNTLVKIRVCKECEILLNHKKQHKQLEKSEMEIELEKQEEQEEKIQINNSKEQIPQQLERTNSEKINSTFEEIKQSILGKPKSPTKKIHKNNKEKKHKKDKKSKKHKKDKKSKKSKD